jgi:hypothetical protein
MKIDLYKQMSLVDKTFHRVVDVEEEIRGNLICKLPLEMQSFHQKFYFKFMGSLNEVFPDDDLNMYLGYKYEYQ